jgi:hypothetical protein
LYSLEDESKFLISPSTLLEYAVASQFPEGLTGFMGLLIGCDQLPYSLDFDITEASAHQTFDSS